MSIKKIKSGDLLLAEPFMLDVYFRRAVILLCEKHKEGILGFILNKPLDMGIHELLPNFPECDSKVMYGGPVATDSIQFLHNAGELLDDSVYVIDGIYWGGDFEKLKILIEKQVILSDQIKFFVGYTGWSPKQLEEELTEGSWVASEMDPNYLFNMNPESIWKTTMENKSNTHAIIGQIDDYMILN